VSESDFWETFIPGGTGGVDNSDINVELFLNEEESKIGLDSVVDSVTRPADKSKSVHF
jgi:hypothetical protein